MISRIRSLFRHNKQSQPNRAMVDQLEKRVLFHAVATSVYSDNRGGLEITFNENLDPATVNTRSVFEFIDPSPGVRFATPPERSLFASRSYTIRGFNDSG